MNDNCKKITFLESKLAHLKAKIAKLQKQVHRDHDDVKWKVISELESARKVIEADLASLTATEILCKIDRQLANEENERAWNEAADEEVLAQQAAQPVGADAAVGIHARRMTHEDNYWERAFAAEWRKLHESDPQFTTGLLCPISEKMPNDNVSARDHEVAATIIQWLGTEVGKSFLKSVENAVKYH